MEIREISERRLKTKAKMLQEENELDYQELVAIMCKECTGCCIFSQTFRQAQLHWLPIM